MASASSRAAFDDGGGVVPRLRVLDAQALALEVGDRDRAAAERELFEVVLDRAEVRVAFRQHGDDARLRLRTQARQRLAHETLAHVGVGRRVDPQRLAARQLAERLGLASSSRGGKRSSSTSVLPAGTFSATAHRSRRGCARMPLTVAHDHDAPLGEKRHRVDRVAGRAPDRVGLRAFEHVAVERAHVCGQQPVEHRVERALREDRRPRLR